MLDPIHFDFCTEFAFVEQSIEVYVGDARFRLDALHQPGSPSPYTVSAYIQTEISNPTKEEPHTTSYVWTVYDLPSILTAKSADDALREALSRLPRKARST